MIQSVADICTAFLASVGACFAQYPLGCLVGMAAAMILTSSAATLRKMA